MSFIEDQAEAIDQEIQTIDEWLKGSKAARIVQRKQQDKERLMMARRALLGVGNRTTNSGGSRVTQEEVVQAMGALDGVTVDTLAGLMGHSTEVVRGHLNRGKGERFIKKDNMWYLRDPKNGRDTEDDIDG